MKAQLLNAWQIHHQMNMLLLDHITDAGMQKTLSARGGRTISGQWQHIHRVRMQWLEICTPDLFKKYQTPEQDALADRKHLRKMLEASALGIAALLERGWDNGGKLKGFKKGVIPMLGYLVSHESHHRGNMLLTLKQNGEKIPDKAKWGLWDWGK